MYTETIAPTLWQRYNWVITTQSLNIEKNQWKYKTG